MGDTVTTMRFYEQIKREKRAKEKWNQKYLTAEQLELERYAEEDDLGDPSSPIANHLSRVTYDEVKEEPDEASYAAVRKSTSFGCIDDAAALAPSSGRNRHRHAIEQVS